MTVEYEAIIGLETHIQLNTLTKIFCSCKADSWDDEPNTNICPVCTGLPGVLPVLNEKVVEKAALLAAAMQAEIQEVSFFDRKNYFYPDLPKGYQISQYDHSLATGGFLDVPVPASSEEDGAAYVRRVRIHKLHIEEDAGKTKKENEKRFVDFNRCGVPLVEMVTEPDLRSAEEAGQYLIRLRQLLRWIGISEADMEKGNLRCDANVSIREKGSEVLNTKTEIKNVNSIDAVKDAIRKEIERQIREVDLGNSIKPWTLDWDDNAGVLRMMRSKETEADYRYFHEPDLLPLVINAQWKANILAQLPELPLARRARFMQEFRIPEYDADILTSERDLADYFEESVHLYKGDAKKISNWLMNDVLRMRNELGMSMQALKLTPAYLAELVTLTDTGKINSTTAKSLLQQNQESGKAPTAPVDDLGLAGVRDDGAIRSVCETIIAAHPAEVQSYRDGKQSLIGWFVGQVMREMRGKADAQVAQRVLKEMLDK